MRFTAVILSALFCLTLEAHAAKKAAKSIDAEADEALIAAAEQLVSEGKTLKIEEVKTDPAIAAAASAESTATAAKVLPPVPGQEKKESEIPVFTKVDAEKTAKGENSVLWRLAASMVLLVLVGGGLIYGTKRYARTKNTTGGKVRIEVLHKHQLTAKNSLAVVRVAGEVVLIGCSDHSVNMLKTITLIDDELEGLLGGKDFNGFLEDDFKIEDVRTALEQRA